MTCHSSNCFSIVVGQENAAAARKRIHQWDMTLEQHRITNVTCFDFIFKLFWFNEVHLELSVQNLIEGGIPSESYYKSLNYREGNNNSPIQDYVHLDDYTQPTYEMTSGFKPFRGI